MRKKKNVSVEEAARRSRGAETGRRCGSQWQMSADAFGSLKKKVGPANYRGATRDKTQIEGRPTAAIITRRLSNGKKKIGGIEKQRVFKKTRRPLTAWPKHRRLLGKIMRATWRVRLTHTPHLHLGAGRNRRKKNNNPTPSTSNQWIKNFYF